MMAAMRCELLKLLRSPVGVITVAAFVGGATALSAVILAVARSGDSALIAKLGSNVAFDWAGLLAAAAQITGAGGFIACGVIAAWVFAREFTDGTITGLFALPVSRGSIALAKAAATLVWVVVASALLASALLVVGLAFGFGMPGPADWAGLGRQVVLAVLTGVVVLPVAWIATATRSLLAAIGGTIGLLVVAQIGVLSGAGGWLPFAAPALWALTSGTGVSWLQLAIAVMVGALSVGGTTLAWRNLQLDR